MKSKSITSGKTKLLTFLLAVFVIEGLNAQFTKLTDFDGISKGSYPIGSLAKSGDELYGMTNNGGTQGRGVIFKINLSNHNFNKLLDFDDISKGSGPTGSLVFSDSVMFGMTYSGGLNSVGVLFKVNKGGSGFKKVVNFDGVSKGSYPVGSLVLAGKVLYGMTELGGLSNMGVIFKVDTDGNNFVKLIDFDGIHKGSIPYNDLALSDSVLYGTTSLGGTNNRGVVFKVKTDGSNFTKLVDFDGTNGSYPEGSLMVVGTVLYGMTGEGGENSLGTVFKANTNGTGFSNLVKFSDSTQMGYNPLGSLTLFGSALYGLTAHGGAYGKGVIFKVNIDGTGFTKLLDFDGTNNGSTPLGSFIKNGNVLYAMTALGGLNNKGEVFQYSLDDESTGVASPVYEKYKIYPNPANDRLIIENWANLINRVDFMSVDGRIVKSQILTSSEINVSGLANGIYLVKIYDKTGGVIVSKIIKQ